MMLMLTTCLMMGSCSSINKSETYTFKGNIIYAQPSTNCTRVVTLETEDYFVAVIYNVPLSYNLNDSIKCYHIKNNRYIFKK